MPVENVVPKNFDMLYPGRFLKAGTLDGRKVTLTIAKVEHERLEGEKGLELKVIVSFVGKDMQLVLAKTNGICLREMFGNLTASWIGKKVTLFEGKVEVAGPMKGKPCIRIWGSPEIEADMPIQIKHPKKKAFEMVMHKVEARPGSAPPPAQPTPPPAPAPETEEIPL